MRNIDSFITNVLLISPHPNPLPRGEREGVRGDNRNIGYAIINKRILLMHISNVSGHFRATYVIESALKTLDPQAQILSVNAFSYTNPIAEKIVNFIYMGMIKKIPALWRLLYDNPKVVSITNKLKTIPHHINARKIMRLYRQFSPDVIICTQAFPCGMVADFKKICNINIPLIGVLTDYIPHSLWIYPNVDYYIVASGEARQRLIDKGITEERIKLFGIPVEHRFKIKLNKEEIIKRLKLDNSQPIVLIMGGAQGIGPIKKIICLLDKLSVSLQLIVVCGTNKKLFAWIKKHIERFNKKILLFGYVQNINELMEASSIIITKPGGLTTAEALVKGLTMVIIKPIPGQEENNTQFLLDNNAAIKINNLKELNSQIESLFRNEDKLRARREAALKLSRPNASLDIAELALSLCDKK